jgi:hypothetical protein
MEPPPPFQGSASEVDDISGGRDSSVTGGLGSVDGFGDVAGDSPMRLTNMVGPCVGQTLGANCSVGSGLGDERWPLLPPVRIPRKRRGGILWSWMSGRAQRTAPWSMKWQKPPAWLPWAMADSMASVIESTMAFMEGMGFVILYLRK